MTKASRFSFFGMTWKQIFIPVSQKETTVSLDNYRPIVDIWLLHDKYFADAKIY